MPKVQKRKYEKIDDMEIDLVVQCNDSHEFYERYRQVFPNKKKGIDSISKIWKRRSEFIKKQQGFTQPAETISAPSHEFEILMTEQNKILAELSGVMKEHLRVSKEILARLPKHIQKSDESIPKFDEAKISDHKEPEKKIAAEKRKDIMIGS
jgi:predicted  nucleic acid-binding Zn-ribbon protein